MEKNINWKTTLIILSLIYIAACSLNPGDTLDDSQPEQTITDFSTETPDGSVRTRYHIGSEVYAGIRGATNISGFGIASLTFIISDTRDPVLFDYIKKEFAYSSGGTYNLGQIVLGDVKISAEAITSAGQIRFKGSKALTVGVGSNNFGVIEMFETQDDGSPLSGLTISSINEAPISDTFATINFATSQDAMAVVEYGTSSATYTATSTLEIASTTTHNINLTGLTANTGYAYRIVANISGGTGQENKLIYSGENNFTTSGNLAINVTPASTSVAVNSSMTVDVTVSGGTGSYTIGLGMTNSIGTLNPASATNNFTSVFTAGGATGTTTFVGSVNDGFASASDTTPTVSVVDVTPPSVSSTIPTSASTDIKVSTSITAVISEAVDQSTVTSATFSVIDPYSNTVSGAFNFSGNSIIFTPASYLVHGSYTVTLTTAIKDPAGNGLGSNYSWQFAVLGSIMVKDILSGTSGSYPQFLTDVNGTLFFAANDGSGANGIELWKSDGTSGGTVLVKDIYAGGANNGNPSELTNVNGTLFFRAFDATNGSELWKSDGTSGGTELVKDIYAGGANSSSPTNFTNVNGTLFFVANDGINGFELWKSNGTSGGTVLVKDIFPGSNNSSLDYLTNVNGTLFFKAYDDTNGSELWKSDGTSGGTVLVKDINSGMGDGPNSSNPSYLTNVNGTLFFAADNGTNGAELWKSNGTSSGTVMVMDINSGGGTSSPNYFYNNNGTLFFSADNGTNSNEPWKSDGTTTTMIKDIDVGGPSEPKNFINLNGTVIFYATCIVATEGEPHRTDGTTAGTERIKDIYEGSTGSDPQEFTILNNAVYFRAYDLQGTTQHGYELWKTNGFEAGTTLAHDIASGTSDSSPNYLTVSSGTLFFRADDGSNGPELWRVNN
ncbi:ELWxxDGT repeat protein [Candidatus Riflebacteria bacterium]